MRDTARLTGTLRGHPCSPEAPAVKRCRVESPGLSSPHQKENEGSVPWVAPLPVAISVTPFPLAPVAMFICSYSSMPELLRVGQCCRELQEGTRASAAQLLLETTLPSEPICAIVPRCETEKRVNRIVSVLVCDGLAGDLSVEPLKEVVRIQLGLARVANQWRQIGRRFILRSALDLALASVSSGPRRLLTTQPLIQQMYIEIGLEEDELARPLGEKTSEISLNWCHEPVNLCTVGNFVLVLRSVCGLRGEIRRYIRLVSDRQEQALIETVL